MSLLRGYEYGPDVGLPPMRELPMRKDGILVMVDLEDPPIIL